MINNFPFPRETFRREWRKPAAMIIPLDKR